MRSKRSDFAGGNGDNRGRPSARSLFSLFPTVQKICSAALALSLAAPLPAAQPAPPGALTEEMDTLFHAGRQLFELLAPADVKAQFEWPTKERWDSFVKKFQRALEGDSLEDLADCAREGREAVNTLRLVPGYEDLADWLEQRIDSFEGAKQSLAPKPPASPQAAPKAYEAVPHYHLWLARVQSRPAPARAAALMPRLRAAFVAEGVPPELAWIAEAESSFNPVARSPVGAKGLFQFMPDTAKAMGLSTFLPDERTDPEKSARAAARYLRQLHGRFGNWALVLAAYNAGEGRVGRMLAQNKATSYTAIAEKLPAETRMYVPKVCALIATRGGVAPEKIAAPGRARVGTVP